MASLDGSIRAWATLKDAREAAGVIRLIADVELVERFRSLRELAKEDDQWLAAAAGLLEDLDRQRKELDAVYTARVRLVDLSRQELFDEAMRLKIKPEKIGEYMKNSLVLKKLPGIKDHSSAATFLKDVSGIKEVTQEVYNATLTQGKEISAEREKKTNGEGSFNESIASQVIPVLFRCEYPEGSEFVQRYFFALHDSFARKVLQSVKEHLRKVFNDLVAEMEKHVTVANVSDFLFTREHGCPTALAKARMWSNDHMRKYAVLLKRHVREEEIKVLNVASSGEGPDELSAYIGKVFRYRVYKVGPVELYPELRHLRDNCHPLYRFLLKVMHSFGWNTPDAWPQVRYPYNWT